MAFPATLCVPESDDTVKTEAIQRIRATRRLRWSAFARELLLLALLAVLCAIFARLSPQFLDSDNLREIARHFSEVGLMALPQTYVILTSGIDLSVGSLLGLSSVALGLSFEHLKWPFWEAAGAALGVGALGGAVNGLAIAWWGMPALVVTLATLAIYRGLAVGISSGRSITDFPDSSSWLGQGTIGPFPTQFLLLVAAVILAGAALYKSPFGRYIYAIGGNETASRLGGVPVDRTRFLVYLLSGVASGLAAVVYVSRLGTARPDAGSGIELDVISAVVLGGTDVAGGDGGIIGTVLGLLILSVLRNGLDLINFPQERQPVVIGALLITAIAIDRAVRRRRA